MGLRAHPTQRQRRLGRELRRLREEAGVGAAEASARAGLNKPHLSHIEAGRTACPEPRLRALLDTYGCSDATLTRALIELTNATGKGWWSEYREILDERARDLAELESLTTAFRIFEWLHVPGLLQTPAYMRFLFTAAHPGATPDVIDALVGFRLRRQRVLTEGPPHPTVHAVIHEAAFHMHFVDRETMRAQLAHLVELAHSPHITIQLMPFRCAAYPATPGCPFTIHDASARELATVYVEQPDVPLFLHDRRDIDHFAADFARISGVSLERLDPTAAHEGSSLGLIQHLRYVL
ncbi:helix-turn-helix domain-containing protein [Streptomyces litchfieldiae]|uniref:Helix-turn-helix transcriptional regulator n=1 Tax=Streptomyces litchfieldiae TaxID=3075543 RepID=A0ABU2MYD6_9ACTN|nr:helix-turn-helix transcriptional regulator [Streptomyces sp. DSM 44938]MDT0346661.1 helix-turn-helix transcriptional regulator [Streptomyces sp. DSM 44938]